MEADFSPSRNSIRRYIAERLTKLAEAQIGMEHRSTLNFILKLAYLPPWGGWPELTRYTWDFTVDGEPYETLEHELTPNDITQVDDPHIKRLNDLGITSNVIDPTRKPVEILECWTDDGRVITMANRKVILRVSENPFDHYEKPFAMIYDYMQPHEFWGKGETAVLEGLQDSVNAIANSRIDNLRLNSTWHRCRSSASAALFRALT